MLDANTILASMAIAGIVAFIARAISKDLGALSALLAIMPFIVLVLGAVSSGLTVKDPTNFSIWASAFITNVIPIILVVFAESTGAGLARKFTG